VRSVGRTMRRFEVRAATQGKRGADQRKPRLGEAAGLVDCTRHAGRQRGLRGERAAWGTPQQRVRLLSSEYQVNGNWKLDQRPIQECAGADKTTRPRRKMSASSSVLNFRCIHSRPGRRCNAAPPRPPMVNRVVTAATAVQSTPGCSRRARQPDDSALGRARCQRATAPLLSSAGFQWAIGP